MTNKLTDWQQRDGNTISNWYCSSDDSVKPVKVNIRGEIVIEQPKNNPSATGALICWQVKITTTGTAVGLPTANVWQLVVLSAYENNVWPITVWVSTWVTNVINWTGNGFILAPWAIIPVVVDNLNKIFINWTANDIVSYSLT